MITSKNPGKRKKMIARKTVAAELEALDEYALDEYAYEEEDLDNPEEETKSPPRKKFACMTAGGKLNLAPPRQTQFRRKKKPTSAEASEEPTKAKSKKSSPKKLPKGKVETEDNTAAPAAILLDDSESDGGELQVLEKEEDEISVIVID